MSTALKQFIGGAFGLIALYLVLANAKGFGTSVNALGHNSASVFKTLQGRG